MSSEELKKPKVIDIPDAKDLAIKGGRIDFKKVKFNYGKVGGIFEELSLSIKYGEKVGHLEKFGPMLLEI